ncbi:MAG: MoxR family ATPase [Oscillospiraceae bacterium]|nr:MoxR family ATPase [Oscillospiraceae bacterium]
MARIIENIERVIVDKRREIELVLTALLCRGHILIEDVPGVGKTSIASALAKSLDCSFKRIQFTPDIMPADITGFSVYNPKTGDFEYRRGAILSHVVLADEINRTSPKTQSSLLEAMEENQVTVDGETYRIGEPFIVIATQNPVDYLGTYPLPEAQLDRFFMRISLGYPSLGEEMRMVSRFTGENPLADLTPVVSGGDIIALQEQVERVYVEPVVNEYIVSLVRHTRENAFLALGASPRASINLYRAAQARALYGGRDFVMPDDVVAMAPHVLTHRLVLSQEARLKKLTQADMVTMAVEAAKVPITRR